MLPPVQPDEALLARGLYQQHRRGQPTEVHERWSIYSLPDGALIWRSELHYGPALLSACYLLRDPDFRPAQMVFYWRWQDGRQDLIEYRFMPRHALILPHAGQPRQMILPAHCEVYGWHTVTEHFVWLGYDHARRGRQTMTVLNPNIEQGTLWPGTATLEVVLEQTEIAPGPDGPHKTHVFAIDQPGLGPQRLHVDEFGVPVRWEMDSEQMTVTLAEYIREG